MLERPTNEAAPKPRAVHLGARLVARWAATNGGYHQRVRPLALSRVAQLP